MRVFACVADQLSFTEAARVLKTSTAAVSRSIKRLEQAVGVQLVNRTTRRVGLTDLGAELYGRSAQALQQLDRALATAKSSRNEASGLLRITSAISFGRRFVVPVVNDFRVLYPDVEIDLSLTDDVQDLVEQGRDIAIRGGLPGDARLISRKLAPMPMYVCASPSLLNRYQPPARPEDLRMLPCIQFRFRGTGQPHAWEFSREGKTFVLDVPGSLCLDDNEALCEAALAGLGFVQLAGYVAVGPIRRGELVPVLLDVLDASRLFCVSYVNRSDLQPLRDTLFVDLLVKRLADPTQFALTQEDFAALRA